MNLLVASAAQPLIELSGLAEKLGPNGSAQALRLAMIFTILSLLPTLILTLSSFTRIIIVLAFVRQGLGVQGVPPNQISVGLALCLTAFIMAPTAQTVYDRAFKPYWENQITEAQALDAATPPFRRFMLPQTREADLMLFYQLGGQEPPKDSAKVSLRFLMPAFLISELRTACEMGFLVLVPFLIIDLLVATILTAMGMVMVPPGPVALPLKLMLFVMVDGWSLLMSSLARSFADGVGR